MDIATFQQFLVDFVHDPEKFWGEHDVYVAPTEQSIALTRYIRGVWHLDVYQAGKLTDHVSVTRYNIINPNIRVLLAITPRYIDGLLSRITVCWDSPVSPRRYTVIFDFDQGFSLCRVSCKYSTFPDEEENEESTVTFEDVYNSGMISTLPDWMYTVPAR